MPATMDKIGEFLKSPDFDTADKHIVKWQFGLLGDFEMALIQAIARADEKNLARLEVVFPMQVRGFKAWNRGGLGKRLREAGLEV